MSAISSLSVGSSSGSGGKLTVGGLASGLDTNKIIEGLTAIDQKKLTEIDRRKTDITTKQSAFQQIEARLLALQTNLAPLARPQNGLFEARTVTSSDATALAAAANRTALPAVYNLRIGSLAKAHQVASQGFDSLTSRLTHGTLQIRMGDATASVTVDSTNDTVQGLANAINNSGAPLTASVVNDGSGDGQQGYRLMLSAKVTGTSNRIVVTNNLAASGSGATKPIFDTGAIGNTVLAVGNTGTSAIQSNAGAGYTGTANNRFQFTVVTGGIVGTDDNLQIAYTDSTGTNTGTITLDHDDVNNFIDVAQGVRVQFGAGTLVAGEKFDVKAFVPTIQEATDASVTLGSGSGAISITSATNQVSTLIPGVALNLLSSDPAKDITLTVANDSERMKAGIQDFVSAYNGVMTFVDTLTSYNAETRQAGILLGNRQAQVIQEQMRSIVTSAVPGANARLNNLASLGISTDSKGYLVVNATKLANVLSGGVNGVTLDDVRKLFALSGTTTNPGVEFVTASDKTRQSTIPYTVNVTQAASKATLTSANALALNTVIDGNNNGFTVMLDGLNSQPLTLNAGTYSRLALTQAVQSAINNDSTLLGRKVSVTLTGDNLTITSDRFGSASQVTMQSGSALASLGFAGGATAQGNNVAGSFTVGSSTETATGFGQLLKGDAANLNTADLEMLVTLSSTQVGMGTQANVTVSRGVASQLNSLLTSIFDPAHGRLKTLDDSYQQALEDLDKQKARQTDLMNARQQALLAQFNAMEQTLSKLQSAGSLLNSQASSLLK